MTDWNFATAYEKVADTVGDAPALICGDVVRTWTEYDQRSARIASVLFEHGLRTGSKVGLLLHNSNEYLEAHHAAMKNRCCPININYRYREEELIYLLENSDSEALVFQDSYADRIENIRSKLTGIKCFLQVRFDTSIPLLPGALDYEDAIASASDMPRIDRSYDDIYMLYTGGTTGMPKGVMYSNGAVCEMIAEAPGSSAPLPSQLDDIGPALIRLVQKEQVPRALVCSPLMHGTGLWVGAMTAHLRGGAAITVSKLGLDPDLLWSQASQHKATFMTIVGDAFARPLLKALELAKTNGRPYKLDSLERIMSSGVMFSQEVKTGILEHLDLELVDLAGASEGTIGVSVSTRGNLAETGIFVAAKSVKVLDENNIEVKPGSEEIGRIACISPMLGYYKDPQKSSGIYENIDGQRWVRTGDHASVLSDGKIKLMGRGTTCINTAGEKVFPEEVEETLKSNGSVEDCLVVGAPDERFGEKVIAVVSVSNKEVSGSDLIDYCKSKISGYKAPKHVIKVDKVMRAPNGKADYKWAKGLVNELVKNVQ